jgi:hypothetical protein
MRRPRTPFRTSFKCLLLLLLLNTTRTRSGPQMPALLLFNTTRIRSGPLSTRASIAMDGGVADTARANTNPDATL